MKFKYEQLVKYSTQQVEFSASRAKVFGGWVLRNVCYDSHDRTQSESSIFIPDPNHEWDISNDEPTREEFYAAQE